MEDPNINYQDITDALDRMETRLKQMDVVLSAQEADGDHGDPERKKKLEVSRKKIDMNFQILAVNRKRLDDLKKRMTGLKDNLEKMKNEQSKT